MSKIALSGNPSGTGTFTIASPNSNTDRTLTLPDASGTVVTADATQTLTNKTLGSGLVMGASAVTSGTAVASTSGTAIDFTGIPSWARRITVMFSGVSTNGSSSIQMQIGAGSFTTTGYSSAAWASNTANTASTTGFILTGDNGAVESHSGNISINLITGNQYVSSGIIGQSVNPPSNGAASVSGGNITISGKLDRIRITTVNGTDTFDAGTINIMWE